MPDRASSPDRPLVTAVIPTRGRPELLRGAIASALRQTWTNLEVVVVLDGPDLDTERRLSLLADPRLRLIVLPEPSGGSAARNAGVDAARGDWIAFLDDDDEWRPDKIERQMRAVQQSSSWFPVISCRVVAQCPSASRVLPSRSYAPGQKVADYLFCRTSLMDSGGLIQSSTLLAPRDLLLAVPFQAALRMHQDWDWIIRVAAHDGVSVSMLSQPLVIWRVNDPRSSVGRVPDWQFSLAWIRTIRSLISPGAFSAFIAVQCAWRAQQSGAGLFARLRLLRAFLFEGTPELRTFIHFLIFCFLPQRLRRWMVDMVANLRGRSGKPAGLFLVSSSRPAATALRKTSS